MGFQVQQMSHLVSHDNCIFSDFCISLPKIKKMTIQNQYSLKKTFLCTNIEAYFVKKKDIRLLRPF